MNHIAQILISKNKKKLVKIIFIDFVKFYPEVTVY